MRESMVDLRTSSRLLSMIAEKLGHDVILLRSGPEPCRKQFCYAILMDTCSYETSLLKASEEGISIKFMDAAGHLRKNDDMYDELVRTLYKILDTGGTVSDGQKKLRASAVSDFMVGCVLNGF